MGWEWGDRSRGGKRRPDFGPQHQVKESESQRTEIASYINQLSIQLHRWQLRFQSLNKRQQELEAGLTAATRS